MRLGSSLSNRWKLTQKDRKRHRQSDKFRRPPGKVVNGQSSTAETQRYAEFAEKSLKGT